MKTSSKSILLDKLGMSASVACAIHCAAVPLLLTFLPLWGLEFLANPVVEIVMIGLSLCFGTFALTAGYKSHRRKLPALLLILGFAAIGAGHFMIANQEAILVPLGGLTIAIAHFANLRFTKICSCQTDA